MVLFFVLSITSSIIHLPKQHTNPIGSLCIKSWHIGFVHVLLCMMIDVNHSLFVIFSLLRLAYLLDSLSVIVRETLWMEVILPRMLVFHLINEVLKEDNRLITLISIEVSCYSFLIFVTIVCNDTHGFLIVNNSGVCRNLILLEKELRAEPMYITHHQLCAIASNNLLNTIRHLPCGTVCERKTEHILVSHTLFSRISYSLCQYMCLTTSW